jgi:ATP-dependent RNA helicase DeaD
MSDNVPLPEAPESRPQEYLAEESFDDLGLSPEVRRAIGERGYQHPTPVQARAFRPVMAGKDLIVRSKTGTGKTAAFGLPLIDKIAMGERQVKALVMCPTRELAMQVCTELQALAKYRDIRVTAIYGGASMKQQEDALESGSAIIVGTPGRVYDHIRRKNMKLENCTHAVLDEADEMLNQGFYEEVTRILDFLPKNRQVLLFSATVPEDIQRLIAKYTTDPETLLLSGDVYTVEHIHHIRYEITDAFPKPRNLVYVLEMHEPENAIIFCNTRDDTELVTAVLNRNGFDAELLNGDLPQKERERVMGKIKRGEVAFMVATDLAARGIDISDLGHVINYSLPEDPAVYLHRVGRTGRIGKKGTALNLTSGRELATLTTLEKKYGVVFEKRLMPTPDEAVRLWTERHVRELKDAASSAIFEGYLGLAAQLKVRPDADELIAVLLRTFFNHRRQEKAKAAGEQTWEERKDERRAAEFAKDREKAERGGRGGFGGRGGREDRPRDRDRGERRDRPPRSDRAESSSSEGASSSSSSGSSDRAMFEALQSGGTGPVTSARPIPESAAAPSDRKPREGGRERGPRRDRKAEPAPAIPDGHVRLWFNLGRVDGLDKSSFVAALETAGAPAGKVPAPDVMGTFSYVTVSEADAPALEALSGKKVGEKGIKVERAKR